MCPYGSLCVPMGPIVSLWVPTCPHIRCRPPPRPEERRFAVFSLAMGPDGREVWGGANDGCLYGYDREVQRRVLRVRAGGDP